MTSTSRMRSVPWYTRHYEGYKTGSSVSIADLYMHEPFIIEATHFFHPVILEVVGLHLVVA